MNRAASKGLIYRCWSAPDPKAVLLLVHGLGAHVGRWESAAGFFMKEGLTSYGVELRNQPGAKSMDGRLDRFSEFYNKILGLRELAAKENPGRKIFLVGESMGALVSFRLAIEHRSMFDGLICISPAFVSRLKLDLPTLFRLARAAVFDPSMPFRLPFDSSMCTRDSEYRKKMDDDPNERRDSPAGLLFDILATQTYSVFIKNRLDLPVLFLIAGEDRIVDSDAAKKLFRRLTVKDRQLVEYPGMYHALSIDIGKQSVFEDIVKWVSDRCG